MGAMFQIAFFQIHQAGWAWAGFRDTWQWALVWWQDRGNWSACLNLFWWFGVKVDSRRGKRANDFPFWRLGVGKVWNTGNLRWSIGGLQAPNISSAQTLQAWRPTDVFLMLFHFPNAAVGWTYVWAKSTLPGRVFLLYQDTERSPHTYAWFLREYFYSWKIECLSLRMCKKWDYSLRWN